MLFLIILDALFGDVCFRFICLYMCTLLLTVSVFYHLCGVDVFHHDTDSLTFSVSGHLWVDAIDAHVTFQSVKPSHGSCSRHRHTQCASCYVGLFPWHYMPIP